MKKLTKLFSMLLVVAMGAMMVACDDPQTEQPEPTPNPEPEQPELSVRVVPIEAGDEYLKFEIVSTGADWLFYVAIDESVINDVTVDLDFVLSSPNIVEVESDEPCIITFEGRVPNTKYYVYAAGMTDDEEHSVLSECVEMTTNSKQYSTEALPTPDYCNVNLTTLSTVDRYGFALSNESNSLYFSFNIYTEKGSNGVIPAGEYTVSNFVAAGGIDLGSLVLEVNGLPLVISEGTLNIELYNEGANIRLDGTFTLVSGDSVTLAYDGAVTIFGTGQGGEASVTFNAVRNLTAAEGMEGIEPGWHEIQFLPSDDSSTMLDLIINSAPTKSYLTGGFYPVFDSRQSAEAMGMGNSWISTTSFYQEGITPYTIETGMDSYIQVTTNMDSGEGDYYEITFALKIRSVIDQSVSTLNAIYKGALGFEATNEEEEYVLEMQSLYVDITSEGTTHTLSFYGPIATLAMDITIEGELPAEGSGDYVWYDITSGTFTDGVMNVFSAPLLEGSRIAIKRYMDTADAGDEGIVKPYYAFVLNATIEGYDVIGEWTSFESAQN